MARVMRSQRTPGMVSIDSGAEICASWNRATLATARSSAAICTAESAARASRNSAGADAKIVERGAAELRGEPAHRGVAFGADRGDDARGLAEDFVTAVGGGARQRRASRFRSKKFSSR